MRTAVTSPQRSGLSGRALDAHQAHAAPANDALVAPHARRGLAAGWNGYRIVPLRDIVAWMRDPSAPLPGKAVALTVDDGHRSVYDVMRPIVLRERIAAELGGPVGLPR